MSAPDAFEVFMSPLGKSRLERWHLASVPLVLSCAVLMTSTSLSAQPRDSQLNLGSEYEAVGYGETPLHNPIARLVSRLEHGDLQLEFRPSHLYLSSLLNALAIDPSSQILVYSRTSLQARLISAATPRAIYFNDTTYVAWIPGTEVLEIVTMDAALGPVFYTLGTDAGPQPEFKRHTGTCLICHDSFNAQGGGVPLLMAKSALTTIGGSIVGDLKNVTDSTPLHERWGGWYVTGREGSTRHLGNILLEGAAAPPDPEPLRRGNLDTLEGLGLFDTEQYLRPTSDVVALLVLEHQLSVQNQITYVKFKAPAVLARAGYPEAAGVESWNALPPGAQAALTKMLDRLVHSLVLDGAASLINSIAGTSGFDDWFQSKGPRDTEGRSLRDLDLQTRLFKYPLSYLIYSAEFDALPAYAQDYVYQKLADALRGRIELYARLAEEDRQAIEEILVDTKPVFVRYLEESQGAAL